MSIQLEVGDELVEFRNGWSNTTVGNTLTIDRVTKTQAISGKYKFKREFSESRDGDLYANGVGKAVDRYCTYYLYTPKIKEEMDQIITKQAKATRIYHLEVKLTRNTLRKLTPEELDIVEAIADKYDTKL